MSRGEAGVQGGVGVLQVRSREDMEGEAGRIEGALPKHQRWALRSRAA